MIQLSKKKMMKKFFKYYWKPILVIFMWFLGIQVFNHVNSWLGIVLQLSSIAIGGYFVFKCLTKNK